MASDADAFDRVGNDAFPLPMPGLFADLSTGAGCIAPPDAFVQSSGYLRLRILEGWRGSLDELREKAIVSLFRETPGANQTSLAERLDRFRTRCLSLGIECPCDMEELLRRR